MIKPQAIAKLVLMAMVFLFCTLGTSCVPDHDFDEQLRAITKPYLFSITKWEFNALGEEVRKTFCDRQVQTDNGVSEVTEYFSNVARINSLVSEIEAIKIGNRQGDAAVLEAELDELQQHNAALADTVERVLETQIREALSQQGIFNPIDKHIGLKVGFPPVNFELGKLPHLLVVSPRDRIESIRKITLIPDMSLEDMEMVENEVDKLGFSSLVTGIGGIATYPNLVMETGNLRFILDAATEEWLHQYLAFKPLGFLYLLDSIGIRRDYEIATMNETLAGMVSQEIGAIIYDKYYASNETDNTKPPETEPQFDFNQEMREIRRAVDDYLALGEIEQAEDFMEQKRQYLATQGYYIRKLNQAYFAFYGAYAYRATSISPIGAGLKELRGQSASLKEFLETVAAMTSRQDLDESVK